MRAGLRSRWTRGGAMVAAAKITASWGGSKAWAGQSTSRSVALKS